MQSAPVQRVQCAVTCDACGHRVIVEADTRAKAHAEAWKMGWAEAGSRRESWPASGSRPAGSVLHVLHACPGCAS